MPNDDVISFCTQADQRPRIHCTRPEGPCQCMKGPLQVKASVNTWKMQRYSIVCNEIMTFHKSCTRNIDYAALLTLTLAFTIFPSVSTHSYARSHYILQCYSIPQCLQGKVHMFAKYFLCALNKIECDPTIWRYTISTRNRVDFATQCIVRSEISIRNWHVA